LFRFFVYLVYPVYLVCPVQQQAARFKQQGLQKKQQGSRSRHQGFSWEQQAGRFLEESDSSLLLVA
jgi:hypothetical protein